MHDSDFVRVTNYRTKKEEMVSRDGLYQLANAIIITAVRDYEDYPELQYAIERFIDSDYFDLLSRSTISSNVLIDFLRNKQKEMPENANNKGYAKRIHKIS